MLKNAIAVIDRKPLSKVFDTAKIMPKVPRTENEKKLELGINIRNQVVPQTTKQGENTIGFSAFPDKSSVGQYNEKRFATVDDYFGRTVRIYVQDNNHMHDTPTMPKGYKWCLEVPRQTVWKNNCMGWTYSNDSLSKRNVYFPTLDHAIKYCKTQGLGYEVEYPKNRYARKISYAANFQWPGHDSVEDTDC